MFSIGDRIKWTSQAAGVIKEKDGTITEIIPIGIRPDKNKYPRLYRGRDCGAPRDHISYIISTDKEYYWPRVKILSLVSTTRLIRRSEISPVMQPQEPTTAEIRRDLLKEMSGSLI